MERGVKSMDADVIRANANKATKLVSMLPREPSEKLREAIAIARREARRASKAGEKAAIEVDRVALQKIRDSQAAFIDFDQVEDVRLSVASAGGGIDLEVAAPDTVAREVARKPIDLD
jgi:hypothetical protein